VKVRAAERADAPDVAAIYNAGLAGRSATFETTPRTTEDMAERIAASAVPYAFLVADNGGGLEGWAASYPYSPRPAYATVAEYSVYVAPAAAGRGVGRALLGALLEQAEQAGLHKITSRIFPENAASLALARSLGFREVGLHRRHARLNGVWRDVVTVEVLLGEAAQALPEDQPKRPVM
jgi:L-amino acid N-acyltransferase YncA